MRPAVFSQDPPIPQAGEDNTAGGVSRSRGPGGALTLDSQSFVFVDAEATSEDSPIHQTRAALTLDRGGEGSETEAAPGNTTEDVQAATALSNAIATKGRGGAVETKHRAGKTQAKVVSGRPQTAGARPQRPVAPRLQTGSDQAGLAKPVPRFGLQEHKTPLAELAGFDLTRKPARNGLYSTERPSYSWLPRAERSKDTSKHVKMTRARRPTTAGSARSSTTSSHRSTKLRPGVHSNVKRPGSARVRTAY